MTTATLLQHSKAAQMIALLILPAIRREMIADAEEYERDCKEWAEQGYRPHYCRHGVNDWVDYDCACWRCEMGEDETAPAMALRLAKNAVKDSETRKELFFHAGVQMAKYDVILANQVLDLMVQPVDSLLKRYPSS